MTIMVLYQNNIFWRENSHKIFSFNAIHHFQSYLLSLIITYVLIKQKIFSILSYFWLDCLPLTHGTEEQCFLYGNKYFRYFRKSDQMTFEASQDHWICKNRRGNDLILNYWARGAIFLQKGMGFAGKFRVLIENV